MKRFIPSPSGDEGKTIEIDKNDAFYLHFQRSILLSLLEQKKISYRQFEKSIEIINKQLGYTLDNGNSDNNE